MNHKLNIFIIIAFCLAACSKEEGVLFTDAIVIEGYQHVGDQFSIKVEQQIPFSENAVFSEEDLEGLSIDLYSELNDQNYTLISVGDGVYIDSNLNVVEGDEYTLEFLYNERLVSAYTYVPTKPQNFSQSVTSLEIEQIEIGEGPPPPPGGGGAEADPVEFTWDNSDNSYYLILVENIEIDPEPTVDFGDEEPPSRVFRKSPTNSSSEFIQSREFEYYGTYRVILYHVLPDYASLYDEESTSSQNLTNPSSSISNGYGIFTGLNSDTLYVEIVE